MDILDIMLAKALTPQGQTDIYVNKANKAAAKAAQAEQDAAAAIATVEAAADEIATAKEEAADLLATAQETLETAQQAQLNIPDTEDIDAEVKKLNVTVNTVDGSAAKTLQMVTTYPDNTLHTENITKLYKAEGENEDGTMTQKAIKSYVNKTVASIPAAPSGGNANISFTTDEAGHMLVVDDDGHVVASNITEDNLISILLNTDGYTAKTAVGLDLDYANKTFIRTQQATNLSMGSDFNQFTMYGGRIRCNVADNGTITAFYGDSNYREDGSNGQVMVFQPKFYYRRTPYQLDSASKGKIIRHESLLLSSIEQTGFKLAPIFNGDLDYVLFPAYDSSLANDKLASVAGAMPLTNTSISDFEALANARGEGWHITNMAAVATNQMLQIVEYGMMNSQTALEAGIVHNPNGSSTCYFITGSTSDLGNATGHATSTQVSINNTISTQTDEGYRAISYRGMENPWGNVWQLIGGLNVNGTNEVGGGTPYICTDFNYTPGVISENYESVGFALPAAYKWINAMGYGDEKYDWVFLPIECSNNANSLLPVGDAIWSTNGLRNVNILAVGGSYGFGDESGLFYYAADRAVNESARNNYGAKLMYIPTKNSIYNANINKWKAKIGG